MSHHTIDRETYRSIKRMSRDELTAFLIRYANELSNDSPSIDLQAMEADIRAIKGIGEKRADEVMKVVEKHVLGVEEVEDECD